MTGKPHTWELECLLCGAKPEDNSVDQARRLTHGNLVALQEHGMTHHDLTQDDFIRSQRIPPLEDGMEHRVYKWRLPSGQLYLRATRKEARPIG